MSEIEKNILLNKLGAGIRNRARQRMTGEQYRKGIQTLQKENPSLFAQVQEENTKAQTELLNKLQFDFEPLIPGLDEKLAEEAIYNISIPYGDETSDIGDISTFRGFVDPKEPNKGYVGGPTSEEDMQSVLNTALHEALHLVDVTAPGRISHKTAKDKRVDPEVLARSFDMVRAFLTDDEALMNKTKKKAKQSLKYGIGDSYLVSVALRSLPQLFKMGAIQIPEDSIPTIQQALTELDKDEQGFVDWIIGDRPEKLKQIGYRASELSPIDYNKEVIARLIKLAPALTTLPRNLGSGEYEWSIDRTGFENELLND